MGRVMIRPKPVTITEEIMVSRMQFPTVQDRASLSLAPKNWDTMMLAPMLTPMNSTIIRFRIGPALPTAASALSPTYFPTTMLSTVL